MSHKRLLGWEPAETTVFEYDGGRLVRAVTTRDAEFDTEQLDLLLAYRAYVDDVGPHGQLMSEARSAEADPNNYKGRYRYQAAGPFWDYADKALGDLQDSYKRDLGDLPIPNGAVWTVTKVPREQN